MDTELGKVLTYFDFISTFTRLMATKSGRLLTLGRKFSTQTLKSSPTSCFSSFSLSRQCFWMDCRNFCLGTFYNSLPRKRMTKIGLISLETLKYVSVKIFLNLLFETRVAHNMSYALQTIKKVEVSRHIYCNG